MIFLVVQFVLSGIVDFTGYATWGARWSAIESLFILPLGVAVSLVAGICFYSLYDRSLQDRIDRLIEKHPNADAGALLFAARRDPKTVVAPTLCALAINSVLAFALSFFFLVAFETEKADIAQRIDAAIIRCEAVRENFPSPGDPFSDEQVAEDFRSMSDRVDREILDLKALKGKLEATNENDKWALFAICGEFDGIIGSEGRG